MPFTQRVNIEFTALTDIVNQMAIEYISLCRPLIRESDLIKRWYAGEQSAAKCISCSKCFRPGGTRCIFNLATKPKGASNHE
jgi:hypothetical protein